MTQVTITNCPICKSTNLKQIRTIKDLSISKEDFHLSQCENCKFLFTNPQPSPDDLWRYYESEDYVSHNKTTKGFIHFWYRQIQKLNLSLKLKAIKPHVPRGTWLDYGAGAGDFVKYVRANGLSIEGLEPSETARKTARDHSIELKETTYLSSITHESIACVTLWHVLEHITNFTEVLTNLSRLLVPEGVLAIAVPNYLSLDAKHYGDGWAAYDVPRHLWHFTEKDILKISESLQLQLVDKKGMIFDSVYVSLLSEKYKNGSNISGIVNGLKSNVAAMKKTSPFSSQIYILKKKAI